MWMSKQALGKGLSDLGLDVILSQHAWTQAQEWRYVSVADIDPDPHQPRRYFDPDALRELAESIRQHGVLQPIVLMPVGKRYQLVAGERRFRAAQMVGVTELPAWCRPLSEEQRAIIALVENVQREELSCIEQAMGMARLVEEHGLTHQAVADAMGISRSQVTNLLRLQALSDEVKEALGARQIDMGHARALLALPLDAQAEWLGLIQKNRWSVRRLESALRTPTAPSPPPQEGCRIRKQGSSYVLTLKTPSNALLEAVKHFVASWHEP